MIRKDKTFRRISAKVRNSILKRFRTQRYSPHEKLQNCIWVFKIGDADDKPSVPHAHAKGTGYRLNAWTGEIYPAGTERKKVIGELTKRELNKLHGDPEFIKFAKKQIEWYRSEYPKISFFVPEWFRLKYIEAHLAGIRQENEKEIYIFLGKAIIRK